MYAIIYARNINGTYIIDNNSNIDNVGTMYTKEEALEIEKADLSDWDSVWVEICENDDEIEETIVIK